jgi:hypothetical protein
MTILIRIVSQHYFGTVLMRQEDDADEIINRLKTIRFNLLVGLASFSSNIILINVVSLLAET